MDKKRVCVLRTDGTNCQDETKFAFEQAGAAAEIIDLRSLARGYDTFSNITIKLSSYDILAIPGGFSHGDYISSGKIFASDLFHYLGDEVIRFAESGRPIIGICNGVQVLTKSGLLPRLSGKIEQTATLTYNSKRRFRCMWTRLAKPKKDVGNCLWTKNIDKIDLPVANGEGRFEASIDTIEELFRRGMVQYQYVDDEGKPTILYPENPSGSMHAIAAICNDKGNVFGIMPHPERYNIPERHPQANLMKIISRNYVDKKDKYVIELLRRYGPLQEEGPGLAIFKNAVEYVS